MRLVLASVGCVFEAALAVGLGIWVVGCGERAREARRAADTMTGTYERLVRAQFTAADPLAAQAPIFCEGERLHILLGYDSALVVLSRIERRVITSIDTRARRRVDSALANKIISRGPPCEELARQGVLGGPWPSDSQQMDSDRKFDEWLRNRGGEP